MLRAGVGRAVAAECRSVKGWLQRLAFHRRIRAIVACASSAAIAVALCLVLVGHSLSLRQSATDRLVSTLNLVAAHAADAVALSSPEAAREQLGYLHSEPAVRAVRLYDASGRFFAGVNFDGQRPMAGGTPVQAAADLPPMGNEAVKYEGLDAIEIQVPVMSQSHQVGTLAAQAHLAHFTVLCLPLRPGLPAAQSWRLWWRICLPRSWNR